jgi:hypothetical protein
MDSDIAPALRAVRVFISSPSDVQDERAKAREAFERLQTDFNGYLRVDPYLWEEKPMQAHTGFQAQIEEVSKFDLFVCFFWGTLGTPIGPDSPETGTQFELRAALESHARHQKPKVLIYRREEVPPLTSETLEVVSQRHAAVTHYLNQLTRKDGYFQRALNSYESLAQFERRFESDMSELLKAYLPAGVGIGRPKTWEGSPFRGLYHFDFEHAPIFFGRDRDIALAIKSLKLQAAEGCAFVLVHGASGAGKSSLVRAGVLPRLLRPVTIPEVGVWRRAILRPSEVGGGDAFDALARALFETNALPELAELDMTPDGVAATMRSNPAGAELLVSVALKQIARTAKQSDGSKTLPVARLALVIDQLEELFTVERLEKQREEFLTAIDALARGGSVWVLATFRSDFYPRCYDSRVLTNLLSHNRVVPPPDGDQLADMIRRPAAAAGLDFEQDPETGRRLDVLLRDEALEDTSTLPLLEFALEELYQKRDVETGLLKLATYDEMDGVTGALAKRAEQCFASASPDAQARFEDVFRKLVIIDSNVDKTAVRQRARKEDVETDAAARELLDRFIDDRLLVADHDAATNVVVVSVAHEALLARWGRLREWIENHREVLRVCGMVSEDMRRWRESARHPDHLCPPGSRLLRAKEVLHGNFLGKDEAEFVVASLRHDEQTKFEDALASGEQLHEISAELRVSYPDLHRKIVADALSSQNVTERSRAAALMGKLPADDLSLRLVDALLTDPASRVKREAANSLVELDSDACFEELFARVRAGSRGDGVEALAHVRAAADAVKQSTGFERQFSTLDSGLRAKILRKSWLFRLKRGAPTLLMVLIPTLVLSSGSAAPFKFLPGQLNYALAQGEAGGAAAVFQGVLATFLWGGVITLCITLHRIVFANERAHKSFLRPWGALLAGALGGLISSSLVLLVITKVCSFESVVAQGWAVDKTTFWRTLLFDRRYFWPYLIMGPGLGVGMAMLANGFRAFTTWSAPLTEQGGLSGTDLRPMVVSLTKAMWRFAWPIVLCLFVADVAAFLLLRSAPRASTLDLSSWHWRLLGGKSEIVEARLAWKTSAWGQGLSIAFDSMTQGLGGFFCMVGMSLGLAAARYGLRIDPRRS